MLVLGTIWNDRNHVVHNRPIPSIDARCAWIHDYIVEFRKANRVSDCSNMLAPTFHDMINKGEETIMHTNAAFDEINRRSGFGVVVRDKQGGLKAGLSLPSHICTTPLCAEAGAVLEGLQFARRLEVDRVTVMSDSLSLIQAIQGSGLVDSSIISILEDIKDTMSSFNRINFCHVRRSYNRFAHKLA